MLDPNNIGLACLPDQKNLVVRPRRRGIARMRHDKIAKHQTSRNDTPGDGVWNGCQAPDAGVWHGCQAQGLRDGMIVRHLALGSIMSVRP
jgi:hypothetical protein